MMKGSLKVIDLGLVEYEKAIVFAKDILEDRKNNLIQDTLLLLEHPHTITAGRLANINNIFADEDTLIDLGVKLYAADRGGDVTYHGPGQLIAWPIIDLKNFSKDVHFYIRTLEDVIIVFLENFNINGKRKNGFTGVWVKGKKVASIGIGISRWVTFHGLSININCDINFFSLINPCGLKASNYANLCALIAHDVEMGYAKHLLVNSFGKFFDLEMRQSVNTSYMVEA